MSISLDQLKDLLSITPRSLKHVKKTLLISGSLKITHLPFNFSHLSSVTCIDQSDLSSNDIALFKDACSTLSKFISSILPSILNLLGLSEDALDFYFSEDRPALSDITNKPDHTQFSVLSMQMSINDTSECTIQLNDLIRQICPGHIGSDSENIDSNSFSSDLTYFFSARSSQTHLELKQVTFYPSKFLEDHDLFYCKKADGLPDNLAYLYRLLIEIDSVLMYHMATSTYSPLAFNVLVNRVGSSGSKLKLSLQHLHQINHLRPNSYVITWQWHSNQFSNFIESKELPKNAESRKLEFHRLCLEYSETSPLCILPDISLPVELSKKRTKKTVKSRKSELSKQSTISFSVKKSKSGTVLDRIKAKELKNKSQGLKSVNESQQLVLKFIDSHLPNIGKTLLCLAPISGPAKIFSTSVLMTKISDSLQHSMTPDQLNQALRRLADKVPEFCTVSSIGKVSGVRLESGWNLGRLMPLIKPVS